MGLLPLLAVTWVLSPAPVLSPSYAELVRDTSQESGGLDRGTAQRLRGTIQVLNVFVSDRNSTWSQLDRAAVTTQVRAGLRFLQGQAKSYGVTDLRFTESSAHVRVPAVPRDHHDFYWTDGAIERATGKAIEDVFASVDEQGLVLVHVNRPGQSAAMPVPLTVVERAVMYNDDTRHLPTLYASLNHVGSGYRAYAHEILHLFGAPDLYEPESRAELARKVCPRDIMLDAQHPRVHVCTFTAKRVGW